MGQVRAWASHPPLLGRSGRLSVEADDADQVVDVGVHAESGSVGSAADVMQREGPPALAAPRGFRTVLRVPVLGAQNRKKTAT